MPQNSGGRITKSRRERLPMAGLTRSFKESVKLRVEREPAFREALLAEAVDSLIAGDVEVGKAMLRDFINATMGFEQLSADVGTPAKSLMRMVSSAGDLTATKLFALVRS